MRRLRLIAVASLAFVPTTLGVVACSSPPEQTILNQFFRAARLRDATALRGFSTTTFDPATQGSISSFDIVDVSAERRTPLRLQVLANEQDSIRGEEAEFTKRKDAYQVENMEAIQRVVRAEGTGSAVEKRDAAVQAAWSKLRDESIAFAQRLTEAQKRLAAESATAKLSLQGTTADPMKQDGERVAKDVTIAASVRQPDGATADKTLVVTLERAVTKTDPPIEGKWIVTGVRDADN